VTRWLLPMSDKRPSTRPRTTCTHRTNSRHLPNVRSSHRKILRAALRHRVGLNDRSRSKHIDGPYRHSPTTRGLPYVRYRTLTFVSHGWQADETGTFACEAHARLLDVRAQLDTVRRSAKPPRQVVSRCILSCGVSLPRSERACRLDLLERVEPLRGPTKRSRARAALDRQTRATRDP